MLRLLVTEGGADSGPWKAEHPLPAAVWGDRIFGERSYICNSRTVGPVVSVHCLSLKMKTYSLWFIHMKSSSIAPCVGAILATIASHYHAVDSRHMYVNLVIELLQVGTMIYINTFAACGNVSLLLVAD